ncbi:hypothetical protein D0868_11999 [Hortaea werneckii]|uniref:Sec1-like protein n=1 Tax=Hortaea werneckii TaxID=91943 RepID=A0A3M6XWJ4_HORWE|nr:hypothetical protein D0868_11999 [Hortaea werneckii]
MAAHPAAKAIDTQAITDKARRDLLQLLEAVRGKKNLVIEKSLAGTIGLFVKFSTLQEYGVDKVFFLENHNVDASQRNIVFLVRGENAKKARTVAEQIRMVRSESRSDLDFTIIWVPRRTLVSNLILEEHGVLGEANITSLDLHFIPLEPDLLSLELEDAFSDITLRKDPTPIFASAQALMRLQKHYGLFPRILGKGDNAKKLADLLQRMREEEEVNASSDPNNTYLSSFGLTPSALVENLIIVDREVDFPTTLATQLTYEGLLDEVFGVSNNQTEVDTSVLGSAPAPQGQQQTSTQAGGGGGGATRRKVQLDSTDKLYPHIRNVNFATIGPLLNRTARRLQGEQQSIKNQEQTMTDLRASVAKLPNYQAEQTALKLHTSLAEELTKFTRSDLFRKTLEIEQSLLIGSDPGAMQDSLEELIARGDVPLETILRLLCLESCLANGLRARELDTLKRQVLQAYGYQHSLTLARLEKMGLLISREAHRGFLNPIASSVGSTATEWNGVRKGFGLWSDDVREDEDTQDVSFVFSGWAPLSVRLVQAVVEKTELNQVVLNGGGSGATSRAAVGGQQSQHAAKSSSSTALFSATGWRGFEDVLHRIRGATVDVTQKGADADATAARKTLTGNKEGPRTTIVFFLGDVTFAEIAALRFLSQRLERSSTPRKLVVCTTGVMSGRRVVDVAVEGRGFGG